MKLLYVTDLHGDKDKYNKIFELAIYYDIDVVVNGGDMLPKGSGIEQHCFITGFLAKHFQAYEGNNIDYVCCLGNDDLACLDPMFDSVCEPLEHVHNIAQKKVKLFDHEFIGMNWVVNYPFRLKDRCRLDHDEYILQHQFGAGLLSGYEGNQIDFHELKYWETYVKRLPTIAQELSNLPKPKDMSKAIYSIHMPPRHLGLDICSTGYQAGSQSVFEFITQHQPLMTLHGHIHESPLQSGRWSNYIGRTICIQPGQLQQLRYVIADTEFKNDFSYCIDN